MLRLRFEWLVVLGACAALSCSDAPKLTRQGNRAALVELFTQTG